MSMWLGAECHESSDLSGLVLAFVRGDVEVHPVLHRLDVVDRHEIEVGEQPAGIVQADASRRCSSAIGQPLAATQKRAIADGSAASTTIDAIGPRPM